MTLRNPFTSIANFTFIDQLERMKSNNKDEGMRTKCKSTLSFGNGYQGSLINDSFIGGYQSNLEKEKKYCKVLGLEALRYQYQPSYMNHNCSQRLGASSEYFNGISTMKGGILSNQRPLGSDCQYYNSDTSGDKAQNNNMEQPLFKSLKNAGDMFSSDYFQNKCQQRTQTKQSRTKHKIQTRQSRTKLLCKPSYEEREYPKSKKIILNRQQTYNSDRSTKKSRVQTYNNLNLKQIADEIEQSKNMISMLDMKQTQKEQEQQDEEEPITLYLRAKRKMFYLYQY